MQHAAYLTAALAAAALFGAAPAHANVCHAGKLMCATTMPVGGFCECVSKGTTEDGTVETGAHGKINATAGGCGTHPTAPGCK